MSIEQKVSRDVIKRLRRHLNARERGKALFKASGAALDVALSNGAPLHVPITIKFRRRGETFERKVIITDNFPPGQNRAFRASVFSRYEVEDYKEPTEPKRKKTREPEPAIAHTAEVGA
jgi:hypothetical protein